MIGVPAPFGRRETQMKWVDPDPKFDQSPQWGTVEQGPESLKMERIKLSFSGSGEDGWKRPFCAARGLAGSTRKIIFVTGAPAGCAFKSSCSSLRKVLGSSRGMGKWIVLLKTPPDCSELE